MTKKKEKNSKTKDIKIETIEIENKPQETKARRIWKKILNIIFTIIIVIIAIITIDYVRVAKFEYTPLFAIRTNTYKDGGTTEYYGLVADTIKIHQQAGFKFYNEIILYNDTGNLAITSGDYLNKARKVGRQHQNVLVFFKGDPKRIKEKFGPVFEEA